MDSLTVARAGFEADKWRVMLMDRASGVAREPLRRLHPTNVVRVDNEWEYGACS